MISFRFLLLFVFFSCLSMSEGMREEHFMLEKLLAVHSVSSREKHVPGMLVQASMQVCGNLLKLQEIISDTSTETGALYAATIARISRIDAYTYLLINQKYSRTEWLLEYCTYVWRVLSIAESMHEGLHAIGDARYACTQVMLQRINNRLMVFIQDL